MVRAFEDIIESEPAVRSFEDIIDSPTKQEPDPVTGVLTEPFPVKREKRQGVWGMNQQLDGLFSGRTDITDLLPLDVGYDFGQVVGMEDPPGIARIYNREAAEDAKARAANSVMYSVMFGMPNEIAFDNIDALNEQIFGKPLSPTAAWRQNQDKYKETKQSIRDIQNALPPFGPGIIQAMKWPSPENIIAAYKGVKDLQMLGVKSILGKTKFLGEFLAGQDAFKYIADPIDKWTLDKGKELTEWSDFMLEGLNEYYRKNPEDMMDLTPGIGLVETLRQYITRPEILIQGTVGSMGLMMEGVVGNMVAGPAGGIALMAQERFGQTYADARAEKTEPMQAFGQALFTSVPEAYIEQWTLGKKLGFAKNFSKIVADGWPRISWEVGKAFFRGSAEEGSQKWNENIWRWFFTDRSQIWTEGVGEAAGAGGPIETLMFVGFGGAGMATGPAVAMDDQLDRLDQIQKAVIGSGLSEKHQQEIFTELEKARTDVKKGIHITWDDVSEERKGQLERIGSQTKESMVAGKAVDVDTTAIDMELDAQATRHLKAIAAEGDIARVSIAQEGLKETEPTITPEGERKPALSEAERVAPGEGEPWKSKESIISLIKMPFENLTGKDEFTLLAAVTEESLPKNIRFAARAKAVQLGRIIGGKEILPPDKLSAITGMPIPKEWKKEIIAPPEGVTKVPSEKPDIKKIQKEITDREAGETEEQLSGITKKQRRSLLKEAAAEIQAHDIYQTEVAAADVREREVGPGFYYVHESGRGEVEAIIGKAKGFKTKLQKMFTFDRGDVTSGRAIAWDTAVQEGLTTLTEEQGEMDLSEFVQRVADSLAARKGVGGLNAAALDKFGESKFPDAEMLAERFRMIQRGSSDIEINEMITEWAERNDVPIEAVMDNFINADKMVKIAELSEADRDAELERLATEQILAEDQIAAQQAAVDVLEANDIQAEVRKVEEIGKEDLPFERIGGRPTGAAMTQGQREVILLAIGADIETGAHEGWHLLRNRLTNEDLATLMDKYGYGLIGEEAEAAAFGLFYKENKAPSTAIRKIFEKIKRILAKIKSALEGKGLRTVEDIFGSAVAGTIEKVKLRKGKGARFETRTPWWYSKLERSVEAKMPNKMDSAAFRNWANKQGIKKEEMLWSGVDELLTKKTAVTKAEVLETIALNNVQIEEVVKGGKAAERKGRDLHQIETEMTAVGSRINKYRKGIVDALRNLPEEVKKPDPFITDHYSRQALVDQAARMFTGGILDHREAQRNAIKQLETYNLNIDYSELVDLADEIDELKHEADVIRSEQEFGGGATQFSQYKLPGGENYREVLLRWPITTNKLPSGYIVITSEQAIKEKYSSPYSGLGKEKYAVVRPDRSAPWEGYYGLGQTKEEAIQNAILRLNEIGIFTEGHWAESNVLAHFRIDDRTDKAGKKVLFIEEIQSDWHQKGREFGYRGSKAKLEWEEVTDLEEMRAGILGEKKWISDDGSYQIIYSPVLDTPTLKPYKPSLIEGDRIISLAAKFTTLEEAQEFAKDHREATLRAVPDAPFKSTWHELAFKRILRYAAEEGYDKVAWTTGEQQAERYPELLRKVVDDITWDSKKTKNELYGWKWLDLTKDDKHVVGFYVKPDGTIVDPSTTGTFGHRATELEGKKLSEAIGKEMAAEILKKESGHIPGLEFNIGGLGMKGFYDKILPAFVKKYMKKWGVKGVGETEIAVHGEVVGKDRFPTVHAVPVTESMKESVMAGQVMFETSGQRLVREAEQRGRINARKARLAAQAELMPVKKKKPKKVSRARLKINIRDELTPALTPELEGALEKKPTEIPGQAYVYPEPKPGQIEKPKVLLDDAFLDAQAEKVSRTMSERFGPGAARTALGLSKQFIAMSHRLENIDPTLKYATRRYIFDAQERAINISDELLPMVEAWRGFSKEDRRRFQFAAWNGMTDEVYELAEKYKAVEHLEIFREVMDEIRVFGNELGMDIRYTKEYWPRAVKDFAGLIDYLEKTEYWSPIEQALIKRKEQAGGRVLTEDEQMQVISTLMRGFRVGGVSLSRPGPARERTIDVLDKMIEQYYHKFDEGIGIYIQDMMQAGGAREFFGKTTKEIQNLKAQKSRLATSLYKATTRIGYKKAIPVEKHEEHISKRREKLQQVTEELEKKKLQSLDDTISGKILELHLAHRLTTAQQKEIAGMFKAIFEPIGMHGFWKHFVKLSYIDTLANTEVAITQLEEMGLSFYTSKTKAVPALARAFTGRSKVPLKKMTVTDINQYIQDLGFGNIGNKLLFALRMADKPSKEALGNIVIDMARDLAQSPDAKFKMSMKQMFGNKAGQVIEDLKSGKETSDINFIGFNGIADHQPIAITEVSEAFARGGNVRVVYMLRQFTLRRFSNLHKKIKRMMVNPAKNPAQFITASIDLMQYLAILTAFGVGKDVIRAWYDGEPFEEDDLWDSVIDNLLQFILLSKWTARKMKQEGLGPAIGAELMPPTKGIDALIKDVKNGEMNKTTRSIPYIGERYYQWFGGGSESGGRGVIIVR